MKIIVTAIISLAFAMNLFAQNDPMGFEVPDYVAVKEAISDPDSELYYPKMMERMKQSDTTLTVAEYRTLYYGYIFQKEFSQFQVPGRESELVQFYNSSSVPRKKYDTIIEIINDILETHPFYLRGLNYLGYILYLKGDEEAARKIIIRFGRVAEAILSSGDGKSSETGFHVIDAGHEYVIMNFLQLSYRDRTSQLVKNYNMIDCFAINGRKEKLYFFLPYEFMNTSR